MRSMGFKTAFMFLALPLAVAGCDITTPSQLKTGQMRIQQDMKTEAFAMSGPSAADVKRIVADYKMNGTGTVDAIVSYRGPDPAAEAAARSVAASTVKKFKDHGIDLRSSTVAVGEDAAADKVVISYSASVARAASNCGRMTGYQGGDTIEGMKQYDIGCESQSAISQMLVRPDDLMGGNSEAGGYARRAGSMAEPYASGKKNDKIQGINASTVGTQ